MSILLDEFGMIVPSSGGGGGGGGSIDFYKCASVSSTTWQGKLASVDPVTGEWSFAEEAVTRPIGRITPVVGGVYDADCTFEARNYKTGIPESGLIFYLPFEGAQGNKDATGKTLYFSNVDNIAYNQRVQGIPCADIGYYAALSGPDFASILPNASDTELTIALWLSSSNQMRCVGFGYQLATSGNSQPVVGLKPLGNNWYLYAGDNRASVSSIARLTGFHHILMTFGQETATLYVDGAYATQGGYSETGKPFGRFSLYTPFLYGSEDSSADTNYVSSFRVYDRVLNQAEIEALAAEFTPTPLT